MSQVYPVLTLFVWPCLESCDQCLDFSFSGVSIQHLKNGYSLSEMELAKKTWTIRLFYVFNKAGIIYLNNNKLY